MFDSDELVDPYPQIQDDVDEFELRREYCEECAGGRPVCEEPCDDVLPVIEEMRAEA